MPEPQQNVSGRLPLSAGLTLLFLCFIWGGNTVSIKFSNQGMPPMMAGALRSVIAASCLWVYARLVGRRVAFPAGQQRHAVIIGLLFGVEFLFVYWGLAYTPASRSSIFLNTCPFWVALGAHFLLPGDRLSPAKIIGLILAFAGVVAVLRARSPELPPGYWIGDSMELLAALFWAASTLYIKRVMGGRVSIDHYQMLFAQLAWAFPVMALGSLAFELPAPISLTPIVIGGLLYQGVIVAFASFLVWFWLISRHPVSRLSAFTFMTPLFTVILGGVLLGEPITLLVWLGLGCVGAGLYLVNR